MKTGLYIYFNKEPVVHYLKNIVMLLAFAIEYLLNLYIKQA